MKRQSREAHFMGPIILKLRRERKWTGDKLAKKAGVSRALIGEMEARRSNSTMDKINKLRVGFDLTWEQLGKEIDEYFMVQGFRNEN